MSFIKKNLFLSPKGTEFMLRSSATETTCPLRRLFQWCVILRNLQQTPGTYLLDPQLPFYGLEISSYICILVCFRGLFLSGSLGMFSDLPPNNYKMTGWKIQYEWTCISYWKFRGCSSNRRVSVHSGVHIFSCFLDSGWDPSWGAFVMSTKRRCSKIDTLLESSLFNQNGQLRFCLLKLGEQLK